MISVSPTTGIASKRPRPTIDSISRHEQLQRVVHLIVILFSAVDRPGDRSLDWSHRLVDSHAT